MSAYSATIRRDSDQSRGWISSRNWDLSFIVFSCALVFLTYGLYTSGISRMTTNLLVTLLLGGPHMFATYTRTAMEPRFIAAHRRFFYASILLIPAGVIITGTLAFTLLLTIFFTVASVHVAEQFSFIAAAYAKKAGQVVTPLTRLLDGGVILMSLHMPAAYLLVRGEMYIGDKQLLFPAFLERAVFWYPAVFVWAALLAAFLVRTANELLNGHANLPKLLFLGLAIPICLYVPTRDNLDVSFQGMNAWHSFQYLALIWFISRLRFDSRQISSRFVAGMTGPGGFGRFYGFCIALTVGAGVAITIVSRFLGFPYEQSYYLVVLSFLLIHYAFDHVLFADLREVVPEGRLG